MQKASKIGEPPTPSLKFYIVPNVKLKLKVEGKEATYLGLGGKLFGYSFRCQLYMAVTMPLME